MHDEAEPASSHPQLHAALLDYFNAPGKYQLSLREPSQLFGSIREILHIAADRGTGTGESQLREAAAFFIRAALLYPGADHYAVLGLPSRTEPVELKERYRLLMRLTHPDFAAAGATAWPADAAMRVNRAYEVLSSPVLRDAYDEQVAGLGKQRPSETSASQERRLVPAARRAEVRPRRRLDTRMAWGMAAVAGILAVLLLMPRPEPAHLVQKKPPPPETREAPSPASHAVPARPAADLTAAGTPMATPGGPRPPPPREPASPPAAANSTGAVRAAPVPAGESASTHATPSWTWRLPAAESTAPATRQPSAAVAVVPAPAAPADAPVAVTRQGPGAAPASPALAAATPKPGHVQAATNASSAAAVPGAPEAVGATAPGGFAVAASAASAAQAPVPRPASAGPAVDSGPTAPAASMQVDAARPMPVAAVPVKSLPSSPSLGDVQPLLTQLLQTLETGSGERLLRLLPVDAREAPAAQALSHYYQHAVRGGLPVRLASVEFKGEPREGVLFVTGRIRLSAGESSIGSLGEKLLVRAEFVSRGGKVQLTGLSGGLE